MHLPASLTPYHVTLSKEIPPKSLGLSGTKENRAFVQCFDPCEITGGGTVIFEVSAID
jgi:uncharacterized repeat protein (TIGR04076 family)